MLQNYLHVYCISLLHIGVIDVDIIDAFIAILQADMLQVFEPFKSQHLVSLLLIMEPHKTENFPSFH